MIVLLFDVLSFFYYSIIKENNYKQASNPNLLNGSVFIITRFIYECYK